MPRITGIVIGSGDLPVPSAAVFVLGGPGVSREIGTLTDASGGFGLTFASPGTYRVGVFAEGEGSAEVMVRVGTYGADPVRIKLE